MAIRLLTGDCRSVLGTLPDKSVQCVVTSPPYFGLRDYGVEGQIGLEPTPDDFVSAMIQVFGSVRRVLRDDGTLWLNLGDSYSGGKTGRDDTGPADLARRAASYGTGTGTGTIAKAGKMRPVPDGLKPKDLLGIPWRVALALQKDGWYLRSDIIWHKPNPMPESVTDRPTSAHEHIFLFAKNERYFYDADAVREPAEYGRREWTNADSNYRRAHNIKNVESKKDLTSATVKGGNPDAGRNCRNVWTIATQPYSGAHFATFPPALIEPCIKAGSRPGDTVLDPFGGAGTTGLVADRLGRNAVLIELNLEYAAMAEARIRSDAGLFFRSIA